MGLALTPIDGELMKILRSIGPILIVFVLCTTIVPAQRRKGIPSAKTAPPAPAQQPGPAFENVLATESYRIYVEIRGVGQLLKTPSFNDVVEPLMKAVSPPKEFKTLFTWLNSQADTLMTSRMMVASWSARPKLPNVLIAIEFASPEEAQKFEPRLKSFLPNVLPTPAPKAEGPAPKPEGSKATPGEKKPEEPQVNRDAPSREASPSFAIKRAGSLVYVSDVAFAFKDLRPSSSKLLTEDPDFRRVHDRFATESVLVYVDTAAMQREDEERRKKYEEEASKAALAESTPTPAENDEVETTTSTEVQPVEPTGTEQPHPDVVMQPGMVTGQAQVELVNANPPPPPNAGNALVGRLAGLLFSGPTTLPDAVGLALAFEPDNYAVRLLLVNEPDAKANPIPFMPQLISGPPMTPEASGIFPGDTEFFVSLSLDYQQIYDSLGKALTEQPPWMRTTSAPGEPPQESPFAVYERKSGIKLKEDLIPLLGNEIALMLPLQTLDLGPSKPVAEPTPSETEGAPDKSTTTSLPSPVIAIAVRDRDGVRALLPKLIESFGVKGASLLAQTEKRGDTEIVSYANALSYAFIGNFLVVSTSPKDIQRVVDYYLNHDTLSSEAQFRNFTRWQPRQVLGQFYLSPKLMESYRDFTRTMDSSVTDQLAEILSRLGPASEPLTYALSNEGLGPMHELRVPKNLALLMLASMFGASSQSVSTAANESVAMVRLRTIAGAEVSFRAARKDGSFGSIDELVGAGLITKELLEPSGYKIELTVSDASFIATAVPVEYGKTGKLSFFIDESSILRAGDHGGGPATVADKPVGQ